MEERLRNEFGNLEIRENGRVFRFMVGKVEVEFKPDSFRDKGFEFFAIFESCKILEIPVLYKFLDYKWKDVYEECLEDGLGEIVVLSEENGLKVVIRTVLHCLENDYFECVKQLVSIHLQVHGEVVVKMEGFKSNPG